MTMSTIVDFIALGFPAIVKNAILTDISCENIWICSHDSRKIINVEELKSFSTDSNENINITNPTINWKLVYDVMRVHKSSVMFEKDHIQRISESFQVAISGLKGIKDDKNTFSFYPEKILNEIRNYISHYKHDEEDINLKFITWIPSFIPNSEESYKVLQNFSYALYFVKSFFPPLSWYSTGTRLAMLYDAHRDTPNAKIIQAPLRARAKALQEFTSAFEVLLVGEAGAHPLVPEGSRSNYILLSSDNRLLCSLERDILVGITLQAVRRAAAAAGLPLIQHKEIFLGDICMAQAIAMLGTSPGVLPVREIQLFYDEESQNNFLVALENYEKQEQEKKKKKESLVGGDIDNDTVSSVALVRERILKSNGLLEFNSAQNTILTKLREAYEAEAFR